MFQQPTKILAPWPAAPGNGATIILACTAPKVVTGGTGITQPVNLPRGPSCVDAIELVFLANDQASATNGIRLYARDENGTWREVDCKDDNGAATIGSASPQAVAALSAGQERRLLIDVSRYPRGAAVEYTAGGTGPTAWAGSIALHCGAEQISR